MKQVLNMVLTGMRGAMKNDEEMFYQDDTRGNFFAIPIYFFSLWSRMCVLLPT